ncbi:RNA polymerase sigma factor 70, region 4 type 2 [uncultured Caudovirales phage]|uniref:RNA polymerase sigma factor 70, region 4 type 2 n=1 Tax=uncultured Caudovirales phage TaxID=2100421 RepID=A0A6J5LB75_9CAUD|nr:RNA polymerase sigma factor 70, region 4 type 2 [uncultured Caudovirales phage]
MSETDRLIQEAEGWLREDLRRAMASLTARQRRAMLLVCVVGLSKSEAALHLGIKKQVAGRTIKAGIVKLEKYFRNIGCQMCF